jgi:hypothetical protein
LRLCFGALAQLARVSDWQSEGHGFDSHTLHRNELKKPVNITFPGFIFYGW